VSCSYLNSPQHSRCFTTSNQKRAAKALRRNCRVRLETQSRVSQPNGVTQHPRNASMPNRPLSFSQRATAQFEPVVSCSSSSTITHQLNHLFPLGTSIPTKSNSPRSTTSTLHPHTSTQRPYRTSAEAARCATNSWTGKTSGPPPPAPPTGARVPVGAHSGNWVRWPCWPLGWNTRSSTQPRLAVRLSLDTGPNPNQKKREAAWTAPPQAEDLFSFYNQELP